MPEYCPQRFYEEDACEECGKNVDKMCIWFFPPRPLSEVLTVEERVAALEKLMEQRPEPTDRVIITLRKRIDNLIARFLRAEMMWKTHITPAKKKKERESSEGAVELDQPER